MIEYIKGDLFTSKSPVLCHSVNCQYTMGSGVAKIIRQKFPTAYKDYLDTEALLGSCLMSKDGDRYIAHLYGQDEFGNDGRRYTSYDALNDAIEEMYKQMLEKRLYEVSAPMIGAGLGNGNWTIIEAIIKANCPNSITTFIYQL